MDGDGVEDLAVGGRTDVFETVLVQLLNTDGSLKSESSIFPSTPFSLSFGEALGTPGDLDDDGIPDLCIEDQTQDLPVP